MSNSELGKLVRGSSNGRGGRNSFSAGAQHHQPQHNIAATRNLYNRQQPLQHAQTHNYRQSSYGRGDSSDADGDDSSLGAGGYNPAAQLMGAASHGRSGSNADNDDDDGANFGPNFDSNVDSDEGQANGGDGSPMNLNQAASGYPGQGNEGYGVGDGSAAGFGGSGFGGSSSYGPSSFEGSEFGPEGFSSGEGRRAKSASSLMGMSNYGTGRDEDAGAPQYGPNSAIHAGGDGDDDARSNYAPEASQNDDNDDE